MRNIKVDTPDYVQVNPNSKGLHYYEFVVNSPQTSTPSPTIITVARPKISIMLRSWGASSTPNQNWFGMAAVIFLPEGINVTAEASFENVMSSHPEWVMAYRMFHPPNSDTGDETTHQMISLTSTLKRNLNSGDRIMVFIGYHVEPTENIMRFAPTITAEYFTHAN